MAEALRTGNIGVMDYMNYKNIQADTGMRDSISKVGGDQQKPGDKKRLTDDQPNSRKGDA